VVVSHGFGLPLPVASAPAAAAAAAAAAPHGQAGGDVGRGPASELLQRPSTVTSDKDFVRLPRTLARTALPLCICPQPPAPPTTFFRR
jgi:hypothetical protein